MTGVQRGLRVTFTAYRDGTGRERQSTPPAVGTVLDQGPGRGEWWVSVPNERGAVLVRAADMTSAAAMHGAR